MQDNHSKYDGDFDEQFEDHAWAEMSKLLDKEMPVAALVVPPTNNKKYLLLLLLFLLVGAGTGWFMGRHHYVSTHAGENSLDVSTIEELQDKTNAFDKATTVFSREEVTPTITATPPASSNKTKESESRQNVGTIKSIQIGTENTSTLNAEVTNSQSLRNSLTTYSSSAHPQQEKMNSQENSRSGYYQIPSSLQTKKNELTLPLEENQKTTKAAKETSKSSKKAVEKPLPKELTRPIAMLNGLDLEAIVHTDHTEELQFNQIIPAKKPFWKPHEIGGELGVYSRELGSIDGLSIGGVLKYKTKSSRWMLQTGLAYENIRTQGSSISQIFSSDRFQGVQEVDGAVYDEDAIVDVIYAGNIDTLPDTNGPVGGTGNQAVEQVLFYNSYSHLHYLTVPFQINYKPLAALELNIGMKLSYLIGTTLQNQSPEFTAIPNLNLFNSNRDFKSTSAIENNKLAKLDARAYVGATWYPNPSLGLSLKCNLGLNKAFPELASDKWSDYKNNAFQASMVYLF